MRKVVLLVAALFASSIAVANDWPAKPVRFIVPYPPGGGTDVIARILQSRLSEGLGHSVIVDNRGGAGGVLAAWAEGRRRTMASPSPSRYSGNASIPCSRR